MRTTLRIDPALMGAAKAYAAQRGMTLTRLMELALRRAIAPSSTRAPPFELELLARPLGQRPDVDVASRDQLFAAMDAER